MMNKDVYKTELEKPTINPLKRTRIKTKINLKTKISLLIYELFQIDVNWLNSAFWGLVPPTLKFLRKKLTTYIILTLSHIF